MQLKRATIWLQQPCSIQPNILYISDAIEANPLRQRGRVAWAESRKIGASQMYLEPTLLGLGRELELMGVLVAAKDFAFSY